MIARPIFWIWNDYIKQELERNCVLSWSAGLRPRQTRNLIQIQKYWICWYINCIQYCIIVIIKTRNTSLIYLCQAVPLDRRIALAQEIQNDFEQSLISIVYIL